MNIRGTREQGLGSRDKKTGNRAQLPTVEAKFEMPPFQFTGDRLESLAT
jgi:hypothetical protein